MNPKRVALIVGCILFLFCGLIPPWEKRGDNLGYFPLYDPPRGNGARVDVTRLAIEWVCISVVVGVVWVYPARKATSSS